MHHESCIMNRAGATLVELMITLAIFSIIMGMIYSVYNTFLKHATTERKVAKTELDVFNVSWPLMKEIQLAGYGTPSTTGGCSTAVWTTVMDGKTALGIHSTAAGNNEHDGKWGQVVSSTCRIDTTNMPTGSKVVVISNLNNKKRLGRTTLTKSTDYSYLAVADCTAGYEDNTAYWIPSVDTGDLECYETSYYLYDSGAAPTTCATNTLSLGRKSSRTAGGGIVQPILDCVLDMDFRFGCINSSGDLTWQASSNCSASTLRLVKVGMVVQNSQRLDYQWGTSLLLFGDLSVSNQKAVTLSSDQQNYKWRKLEQTVTLRNTK